MGFNRKDLELLVYLRELKRIPPNPHVIELGAQQLDNSLLRSEDLVRKAEAAFGARSPFALPAPRPSGSAPSGGELLPANAPFARDLWIALGFEYSAIDVDGSPGSIPLDLNYDSAPPELRNKYNVVTNFGTTEHVCNQLNAFNMVHDLAAPGAVMIHHLPAGGALNHGMVNYNPKFFWYLARSNDYKWLYANYSGGERTYPIAENILEFVKEYEAKAAETLRQRHTADFSILIALQKTLDIPFVPPIDVDTGTKTSIPALNRRYWTVFQPEILKSVHRGGKLPEWLLQRPDCRASNSEEYICNAVAHAVVDSEESLRRALVRIPGRRFVAFVAAASTLSAAGIVAAILVGARLIGF